MDLKGVVAGRCLLRQAPSRRGLLDVARGRRLAGAHALVTGTVVVSLAVLSPTALARSHPAPNPPSNFKPGPLPSTCASAPTGARCINAAVYYLDQARARLHL